ncbi:hypothetical protein DFJ43DRAFT_989265 [Lentinula guzmanii]|uniref:DUF202 domain-containing protein n=1 Tax=Lentinula guzmanii TaxID=2804957 RepID=A0AA38JR64_9AGAR|nr:hypothetical protein DFJ43DRAFT_989265 [Lentinula guzmanii]
MTLSSSNTPFVGGDTNPESEFRPSSSSTVLRRSVSFKLLTTESQHLRSKLPEEPERPPSPLASFSPTTSPTIISATVDTPTEEDTDDQDEVGETNGNRTQKNGEDNSYSRWRRKTAFKPRLVLENSGSVARDHLALERTFLAYVRTSLAIASTGVALVQLFTVSLNSTVESTGTGSKIQSYARPLGSSSVGLGIGVLLVGLLRYFTVQTALTEGKFPVSRLMICGIALSLLVIVTIVFAVLIAGRR